MNDFQDYGHLRHPFREYVEKSNGAAEIRAEEPEYPEAERKESE